MLALVAGLAVVVAAGGAGCSGDDDDEADGFDDAGGSGTTEPNLPPATFRSDTCPMEVPATVEVQVDCGWLTVPENRDDPETGTIDLAVAVLHSRAAQPKADPVVELTGGPGYPALPRIENYAKSPILDTRDLVLFDQRGLGFSKPSLNCAEVDEAIWQGFETTDAADVEGERILDALGVCHDRLVEEGVDLDGYDTPNNAADVADLRVALGIDEWNLRGVSYGSALAIETMRIHPEGIRSVLLDSVVTPDGAFGGVARGESALRAFGELYDACAAQPACAGKYGDLSALVHRAADGLDVAPHGLRVPDAASGRDRDVRITGGDLWAGFFNAMYDETLIPALPAAASAIAGGDLGLVDAIAPDGIAFATGAYEGMTASVTCADRQRLLDPDSVEEFTAEHPELTGLVYLALPELACEAWDVESDSEDFNELLDADTDVPVIVMAGQFDPITPPDGSRRVAEALGEELLLFPNAGHGAVGLDCARGIWFAFMDNPDVDPDTSCMDALVPPTLG
jgi:pimeloyl-ACP methyl ester carboxylesterase